MTTTAVHIVWFVAVAPGRPESGPLRTAELKAMAADGRLQPGMLVRRIGMPRAVPAAQVKGLFAAATPAAATPPAVADATPRTVPARALAAPVSTPTTPPTAVLESARRAGRAAPRSRAPRAADAANPYAPPADAATAPPAADGRRPAGFWLRAAALLLDTIAAIVIAGAVLLLALTARQPWLMSAAFLVFPLYRVVLDARGGTWGKRIVGVRVVDAAGGAIGFGRATLRQLHFLVDGAIKAAACAWTIASLARGGAIAVGEVLPASRMLDAVELLLAAYWLASCLCVPFDARKRALHDRLAGSRCVVASRARPRATRVPARRPLADRPTARIVASDPPTTTTAPAPRRAVTTRRAARRAG